MRRVIIDLLSHRHVPERVKQKVDRLITRMGLDLTPAPEFRESSGVKQPAERRIRLDDFLNVMADGLDRPGIEIGRAPLLLQRIPLV